MSQDAKNDINEDAICAVVMKTNVPLVLRGFVKDWPLCHWSTEQWCSAFGNRDIPFKTLKKNYVSDEPCWDRKCEVEMQKYQSFLDVLDSSDKWMYFDYKYLHQWFNGDDELFKEITWKHFGFPDKGARDTTLWVGSQGSHTPAHRDTYGVNIVAQLYGSKRWLLFPPETGGMKPTRVPYEESSIYSELNFFCPVDLEPFKGLTGGRWVSLSAGDALVVPRGWWHYVQNIDPLNIAVNTWLPHEKDISTRVSEALTKIVIAQICKDLPQETRRLLINPNEDDIADVPLAVLFLELETVAKAQLAHRRTTRRAKRQKTTDDPTLDIPTSIKDDNNSLPDKISVPQTDTQSKDVLSEKISIPEPITGEEIVQFIKDNLKMFCDVEKPTDEDDIDGSTNSLCLTKALIDAFSESRVIEQVKQNLFAKFN